MKEKNVTIYPAVFTYVLGQDISVVFPDLDVATCGVDETDALLSAKECLGVVLNGLEEDGLEIPKPSHLNDLKLKPNEKAVLVDVFMPAVRLAQRNKSVNRTVTLPAWMNAKAQELGINFSQLLQEAIKKEIGMEV